MTSEEQNNSMDFNTILASLVHDMKNSLGMLLNTLDELIGDCELRGCTTSDLFPKIQYEAKRVNNNLIQLLTIYKIGESQYPLNISHNSVFDFIEEQSLLNKPLLDFKNIDIEIDCAEDLFWAFDRDLVAGVLNNVLNNSFRYAKDKIKISAIRKDGFLIISLEDNGSGYPESMLTSDLDSGKGTSFQTGSTGLGLYFSSTVAKMHKNKGNEGSVCISNGCSYGGGCFTIKLP